MVVVSSDRAKVDAATRLLGPGSAGHVADLSDERASAALFAALGPFDHLVYTAGDAVWQRPLPDIEMADAKRFFEVRFWGAFAAAKYGAASIRPGGSIVLTSSTVPRRPSVGFSIGAVALKAGGGAPQVVAYVIAWALFAFQRLILWEIPFMPAQFVWFRAAVSLPFPFLAAGLSMLIGKP